MPIAEVVSDFGLCKTVPEKSALEKLINRIRLHHIYIDSGNFQQ